MMKFIFGIILSLCGGVFPAMAAIINCPNISFNENEIRVNSGAHAPGVVISHAKRGTPCSLAAGALWYHAMVYIDQPKSDQMYNDGQRDFAIWQTGIKGVGYIVDANYEYGDIYDHYGLKKNVTEAYHHILYTGAAILSWFKAYPSITLVTTGEDVLIPGEYNASIPAVRYGGGYYEHADSQIIYKLNFRFGVAAQACTASASSYNLDMGIVPSGRFNQVGSKVTGSPVNITLICKDNGVGVMGMFSDMSELSNTSDMLNLTSDSTARGVKVQLLKDNSAIRYDAPNEVGFSGHQVRLKEQDGLTSTFTLVPQYVQTDTQVTGGTANAVAVVTFSYD